MNSTTAAQTPDFWLTSGWHLCDHGPEGRLMPSADFMLAYFHRPELALVEESCAAETALHEKLISDPFAVVTEDELAALADPDVAHNYLVADLVDLPPNSKKSRYHHGASQPDHFCP